MYIDLKVGEVIQEGDEYNSVTGWFETSAEGDRVEYEEQYRRPIPATFEESSNFEPVHVSQEAVIYPKADDPHWLDAKGHESVAPIFKAAIRTLEHLNYEHLGGEQWKPPIGMTIRISEPEESITKTEEALWQLLDDIDTAFDMFKPEMINFERYVNRKCRERVKYLNSPDGQGLVRTEQPTPEQLELDNKNKAITAVYDHFSSDIIPPTWAQLSVLWDNGLLNITK